MRYIIIYFFITNLMSSCGQKSTLENDVQKQISEQTGIIIPHYTMVSAESSSAVGDYSESFLIKFDSLEFDVLVNRILETKNYSGKVIAKTSDNVNDKPTNGWKKYESGYKFEINISRKENVAYYVNANKQTLNYVYIEE